jgi:chemotaxis protein MotB
MKTRILYIITVSMVFVAGSCVPTRQYKTMENNAKKCAEERDFLKSQNQKLTVDNTELVAKAGGLQKDLDQLAADTMKRFDEFMKLRGEYNQVLRRYNNLQQTQETMIKGSAKENSRLLRQLQTTQEDLQGKEDELHKIELTLQNEKNNLDQIKYELEQRNAKLIDLQHILSQKDSAVQMLKNKVTNALLGYENQGLSVNIRNGKVYVSMEEKLLFKSGSYAVDPNGEAALKKLARILEQNPDINIMIEGHTDDVPYIPNSNLQDNWDLSVKRATSIVRILLTNTTIDPKRLIAAGRGEFVPVDPSKTADARQKNRRTEIILTPRLDELLKILESN